MYITVNVRRDNSGLYATGYDKPIPHNVRILGMYEDMEPGQPDTAQTLLRISHPTFGMLGIAETEQSLADRINAALCCDASGAMAQLDAPELDTPSAGDQQISIPFQVVTDATGYQAQASSDDFATIAGTGTATATPIIISGLVNGGVYKVRVRATAPGFSPSEWTEAAGTFTPASLPAAAPPTAGIVDDDADTFAFTLSPDALLAGHEFRINGGAWAAVSANPIVVGDIAVAIGALEVRVAEVPGVSAASSILSNATAFNVAPITVEWASVAADPHTNLSGGLDPYTYTGSDTLASLSDDIVIDVHDATLYPENDFLIVKVPSGVTNKTLWTDDPVNAPFHNGSIPDSEMRDMVTFGGFDYYYSRVGEVWDHTPSSRVTLS